jgi:hypothetical protein
MDSHKTRITWTQSEAWKMYEMLTHLVSHKDALDTRANERSKRALIRALSSADDLLHALYEATEPTGDTPPTATPVAAQAEDGGTGVRYEARRAKNGDGYFIWKLHGEELIATVGTRWAKEADANAEANRLNAGNGNGA